jgi:hypothetical protein
MIYITIIANEPSAQESREGATLPEGARSPQNQLLLYHETAAAAAGMDGHVLNSEVQRLEVVEIYIHLVSRFRFRYRFIGRKVIHSWLGLLPEEHSGGRGLRSLRCTGGGEVMVRQQQHGLLCLGHRQAGREVTATQARGTPGGGGRRGPVELLARRGGGGRGAAGEVHACAH